VFICVHLWLIPFFAPQKAATTALNSNSVNLMNPDNSQFGLKDIGQVALTITDLDTAVSFYRDVLGAKHLFSAPPGLAFFGCGSVRLMLSRPEKPDSERFSGVIYFNVPDIDQAHRILTGRGIAFEAQPHLVARMPDHELWMAFFRDPDRNLLGLMCEKR
jgi:catechol 2,3-dioxygenase-like lactoylglutathione lyase family enzyme